MQRESQSPEPGAVLAFGARNSASRPVGGPAVGTSDKSVPSTGMLSQCRHSSWIQFFASFTPLPTPRPGWQPDNSAAAHADQPFYGLIGIVGQIPDRQHLHQ